MPIDARHFLPRPADFIFRARAGLDVLLRERRLLGEQLQRRIQGPPRKPPFALGVQPLLALILQQRRQLVHAAEHGPCQRRQRMRPDAL